MLIVGRTINLAMAVANFYQPLYRFAYSLTHDQTKASDLTRQTFLILSRRTSKMKAPEELKKRLFTALQRECARAGGRRSSPSGTALQPGPHDGAAEDPGGHESAYAHVILDAMEQIEEPCRTSLKLFYLGELSCREIAGILKIPIGTVMSRLSQGKEQLQAAVPGVKPWPRVGETLGKRSPGASRNDQV